MLSIYLQVSNVENLSPQVIRSLAKEIADLCNDPPEGIKIFPNDEDITDIQAHIEGPGKVNSKDKIKQKNLCLQGFPIHAIASFVPTLLLVPQNAFPLLLFPQFYGSDFDKNADLTCAIHIVLGLKN